MPIVPATRANLVEAGRRLAGGGLVAFPTETVYGLGADATDGRAVAADNVSPPSPLVEAVPEGGTSGASGNFPIACATPRRRPRLVRNDASVFERG